MRYLLILILALGSLCASRAEQRVIQVQADSHDAFDMSRVDRFLTQGWRVIHISSSAFGTYSTGGRIAIFVLESPASVIRPPVSDRTQMVSLDYRSLNISDQEMSVAALDSLIKSGWTVTGVAHSGPAHLTLGLRGPN